MSFKTIMSPAREELYPLRILEVRVALGDFVEADTLALEAETATGKRIAITCAQSGRVINLQPAGTVLEKRQMLLLIETFDDATQAEASYSDAAPNTEASQASGAAQAAAYASARGRQERVHAAGKTATRETTANDTPPTPEEEPAVAGPGEYKGSANPAGGGRLGKVMLGVVGVIGMACVGFYALTYTDAFDPAQSASGPQVVADTNVSPTEWMTAPALTRVDTFTYDAKDGAIFYSVDIDSDGTALLAGISNLHPIVCAFKFGAGDPSCSAKFELPVTPYRGPATNFYGEDMSDYHKPTYPIGGFIAGDVFGDGDALVAFDPPGSDDPTVFYRYNPASAQLERFNEDATIRVSAFDRSNRHAALLGLEVGESDLQTVMVFDHAGRWSSLHFKREWTDKGEDGSSKSHEEYYSNLALIEEGENAPRIEALGHTSDGSVPGYDSGIVTHIPVKDDDKGAHVVTSLASQLLPARTPPPEGKSLFSISLNVLLDVTARAYNPATGATATAVAMATPLGLDDKTQPTGITLDDGPDVTYRQRYDVQFDIKTVSGKRYIHTLVRNDDFPGAGLQVTRILPLPDGRFVLLLREYRGYPFSGILIVDATGTTLRQKWSSGELYIQDIALADNGDLYAAGASKKQGTDTAAQAVLQRYRAGTY